MSSFTHYKVAGPHVIHETLDGEVVIINLETGKYYSLDQIGASLWDHMVSGTTAGNIIAAFAGRYEGRLEEIEDAVNQLIAELQQEGLIQANHETAEMITQPVLKPPSAVMPFEAPVLKKYDDMQDLLLLDPIHEVDEMGWPVTKQEPESR